MSATFRWLAFPVVALACVLAPLPGGADAQKPKKPDPDKEEKEARDNDMKDLVIAYRLKELGQDKTSPSPASLIAAATIFRQLSKFPQGETFKEKPTIEIVKGEKSDKRVYEGRDAP